MNEASVRCTQAVDAETCSASPARAGMRTARGHALALLTDAEELAIECRWPRLRAASLAQQVQMHIEIGSLSEAMDCARRLETLIAT
jgi:LuxR family maltose regulon positive regulatory protein